MSPELLGKTMRDDAPQARVNDRLPGRHEIAGESETESLPRT